MEFCVKLLSLPLWERGLKFFFIPRGEGRNIVAPLVGAWIEIYSRQIQPCRIFRRSPCGSVD